MSITYRTTGAWGAGKGANLTPAEVDTNFWQMVQDLLAVQTDVPQPAEISNIEVIGTQMRIFLSNGDSYGPYTLPYAMFRFRGEWAEGETYAFLDLVTVQQMGMYFVNKDHTAVAPFDPARVDGGDNVYTLVFGESSYVYSFGFFYPMRPGQGIAAGGYIAAHLFGYRVLLQTDLPGSFGRLRVAPAADLSFAMFDSDDNPLGSLDFAAGETVGTFTFAADWTSNDGDWVYFAPPVSIDDTARDLMITIVGTRTL